MKTIMAGLIELNLQLHQINKRLETQYGVSLVQWSLLTTLQTMPAVSQHVLAKAIGITTGSLTQALVRLEKKKFIFTCDDPNDARKKMISLTRQGKEFLERAEILYQKIFSELHRVQPSLIQINGYLKTKVKTRLDDELKSL
jgi:DNA-binding MarR family transcriptional regulator